MNNEKKDDNSLENMSNFIINKIGPIFDLGYLIVGLIGLISNFIVLFLGIGAVIIVVLIAKFCFHAF